MKQILLIGKLSLSISRYFEIFKNRNRKMIRKLIKKEKTRKSFNREIFV